MLESNAVFDDGLGDTQSQLEIRQQRIAIQDRATEQPVVWRDVVELRQRSPTEQQTPQRHHGALLVCLLFGFIATLKGSGQLIT